MDAYSVSIFSQLTFSVSFFIVILVPGCFVSPDSNSGLWLHHSSWAIMTNIISQEGTVPKDFESTLSPKAEYIDIVFDALVYFRKLNAINN